MEMLHIILWMIYPYTVIAILGMGLVWQYDLTRWQDDQLPDSIGSRMLKKTAGGLLILSFLSGIAVIFFYSMANEPVDLFYWVVSLIQLKPNMEVIESISILSRIHLILLLTSILVVSLTKYVYYIFKPHRYIKKRLAQRNFQ
jgi:nitrate reductase gamma subunit